jgi:hypothetical protein
MQRKMPHVFFVWAFLAVLSIVGAFRCSKSTPTRITDTSTVVVEPGRGIPKLCEVGMSFSQIKRAIGEGSTHGLYDRDRWNLKRLTQEKFVLFPSLGVIGVPEQKGGLPLLTFYVQPYDSSITSPGLTVTRPFRGRLGSHLSFSNHVVSRREVEVAFGVVTQGLTNSSQSLDHIDKTQPYFNRRGNEEELYYYHLGLRFSLRDDAVSSFSVCKPAKFK